MPTMYTGAAIDGPLFGRNLICHTRNYHVAVTPGWPKPMLASADSDPEPIEYDEVVYTYSLTFGVWTSGIPTSDLGDLKLHPRTAAKYRRKGVKRR